jgi:iron complex transport system ATP-binding protein
LVALRFFFSSLRAKKTAEGFCESFKLELRSVSVGYGATPVLRGVELTVGEGELVVLAGPNGSGKTTLLKTAGGLLAPLEGKVLVNGKDVSHLKLKECAALTAFLFQVRESPWPFTVRKTVA